MMQERDRPDDTLECLPASWAPLEVRLQRLPDTTNKLRELAKRWDNRLVLKGLSLSEAYLDGRLAVALIVKIGRASGSRRSPARKNEQNGSEREIAGNFILILNAHNVDFCDGEGCEQQPVLVDTIKLNEPRTWHTQTPSAREPGDLQAVRAESSTDRIGKTGDRRR